MSRCMPNFLANGTALMPMSHASCWSLMLMFRAVEHGTKLLPVSCAVTLSLSLSLSLWGAAAAGVCAHCTGPSELRSVQGSLRHRVGCSGEQPGPPILLYHSAAAWNKPETPQALGQMGLTEADGADGTSLRPLYFGADGAD